MWHNFVRIKDNRIQFCNIAQECTIGTNMLAKILSTTMRSTGPLSHRSRVLTRGVLLR